MKITFLGTGTSQGVPVIGCACKVCKSNDKRDKRFRTSLLLEINGKNIVIDAGPDFRMQMLRAEVSDIHGILISHEHKDHVGGLDDVRAYNFMLQKPIDIFCEERVANSLRNEYSYVFAEKKYPGAPQINLMSIDDFPFFVEGVKVIPIRVYHHKLPVYGFRIGDFTYITDASFISEKSKEKIIGSKYLVLNALRKQKHMSHFSLNESLKLINELSPRKAYLIHMSHQMGLHEEVEKELPENVFLAYDGLSFTV